MSRLAVDNMGRIYQVNGDRDDGQGSGTYPTCQSQSDTTLGNAYLQAQSKRSADLIRAKKQQEIMNFNDEMAKRAAKLKKRQMIARDNAMGAIQRDPRVKEGLLRKAIQMGCKCDDQSAQMNGRLTANGESGWRGMTRDQQIIHHELTGMGQDVSRRPDAMEVKKRVMSKQAENLMRIKARK